MLLTTGLRSMCFACILLACCTCCLFGQASGKQDTLQQKSVCSITSVSWTPAKGAEQKGTKLPSNARLLEGEAATIAIALDCVVSKPAYASVALRTSQDRSTLFKLKESSGRWKSEVKATELKDKGNTFQVIASIGDEEMQPLQVDLGTVKVYNRNGEDLVLPSAPTKQALTFKTLPEITHRHRPEHVQPPMIVPFVKTGCLLIPIAMWAQYLTTLDLNVAKTPTGAGGMLAVAFQVSIGAALMLAIAFWAKLTLVDVMLPLLALAVVMVVLGHRALSQLADARIKKESKGQKGL